MRRAARWFRALRSRPRRGRAAVAPSPPPWLTVQGILRHWARVTAPRLLQFWRTHVIRTGLRWWTRNYTPPLPSSAAALLARPPWGWGTAWVDEDGQIQIRDPDQVPGVYPVLVVPPTGLRVWVNGQAATGEVVVQASDLIEVECEATPPVARFAITVDADELTAVLAVEYAEGVIRRLEPGPPHWRLTLAPAVERVSPPEIPVAAVLEALDRQGIRIGRVDAPTLASWLAAKQSGRWVVAQGIPPDGGEVDRYERVELPPVIRRIGERAWEAPQYVEAGTIVATLHPGRAARPGMTVRGATLQPPPPPAPPLQLGSGLAPMQHGAHLVATTAGRVVWTHGYAAVVPEEVQVEPVEAPLLAVPGDAVLGAVRRQTVVVAGDLTVLEAVEDAEVVVGGRLHVFGGVRRSRIWQGLRAASYEELLTLAEALRQRLQALEDALGQVLRHAGQTPLPRERIVSWLLDTKFPQVADCAKALRPRLRQPPYRSDAWARLWGEPLSQALQALLRPAETERPPGRLETVMRHLEAAHQQWTAGPPPGLMAGGGTRILKATAASTVQSGDDLVLGDAERSDVEAAQAVQIHGALVGGTVHAGRAIAVHTVGSDEQAVPALLEIQDPHGSCALHHGYPPARVRIGLQSWSIDEEHWHWRWDAEHGGPGWSPAERDA
ncbi:MAG: FapA family protein [Firmicutes bacterium]|nr:FapA family protein [Bacillota bacterium]